MAAIHNFKIDQGTDTTVHFVLKNKEAPLNLSGYKAAMQLREATYSVEAIDTLTTENNRLVIEPEKGKITATFPNKNTEGYKPGFIVYDLEIEAASGEIKRILQGRIQVIAEVTRVNSRPSN